MVLGRNLEQAWESLVVLVDAGSYALSDLYVVLVCLRLLYLGYRMARLKHKVVVTYVLVDQYNRNILPLPGELVECFLDSGLLSFGVDDKVVLLRVRSFGDMLWEVVSLHWKIHSASASGDLLRHQPARYRSLSPTLC